MVSPLAPLDISENPLQNFVNGRSAVPITGTQFYVFVVTSYGVFMGDTVLAIRVLLRNFQHALQLVPILLCYVLSFTLLV